MGHQKSQAAESKVPLVELEDLTSELDQIDNKLKCSEEDRQELKNVMFFDKTKMKIWTTTSS